MSWTKKAKAKQSAALKKHWRLKRRAQLNGESPHASQQRSNDIPGFDRVLGRIEGWLEAYAIATGVSPTTLTYRVGEALYRSSRRQVRGT